MGRGRGIAEVQHPGHACAGMTGNVALQVVSTGVEIAEVEARGLPRSEHGCLEVGALDREVVLDRARVLDRQHAADVGSDHLRRDRELREAHGRPVRSRDAGLGIVAA